MPVSAYFKGHGNEVMTSMMKKYGSKKGKSVFYATANKTGMKPMADHLNEMKKKGMLKGK